MKTMQQLQIVFLYIVMMIPLSRANNMNQSHKVSVDEAQAAMRDESANGTRLAELRRVLESIYQAVPKNEHGRINHQTVRYVLHRFFIQRHGWFIKGLALNETQSWHVGSSSKTEAPKIKDWVPSLLEDQLEQGSTSHAGTDLDGLAVLAVTLEQLVRNELHDRLKMAYSMHGWEVVPLSVSDAHALIYTYFVSFLMAGNWEWNSLDQVRRKEALFARKYPSHNETMAWMEELKLRHRIEMGEAFGTPESLERFALKIGEEYFKYANSDCKGMKHTLMGMEGKKAGRVRLSTFYSKSLFGGFKFNERQEYLQALGALDNSDPSTPQVIISNYVMARPNCLEASTIYAVCCSNECEDLVSSIESHFRSSFAQPKDIVDFVSTLGTDTVQAPRTFDTELVLRLQQVADQHHGTVPLHGRLFSQWLHHAFPRECPYPQKAGSTSPLTPWEWAESSSEGDSEATNEEMQKVIDDAVCEVDSQGKLKGPCQEDASLPWSDEEELLGSYATLHVTSKPSSSKRQGLAMMVFMVAGQAFLVVLFLEYRHALTANQNDVLYLEKVSKNELDNKFRDLKKACLLWLLVCVMWAIDFLDAWVFACGAFSCIIILALRQLCRKLVG
jgi:hypothetical protein